MPKKAKPWKPKTQFKASLHRLTQSWGSQARIAEEIGVPRGSLNNWSQLSNVTLPNVEQAYFISLALGQNLIDMIGGQSQPRLTSDAQLSLRVLERLSTGQRRTVMDTIRAFAHSAGISDTVQDDVVPALAPAARPGDQSDPSTPPSGHTPGRLEQRPKKPLRSKPTSTRPNPDGSRSVREVAPDYGPSEDTDTLGPVPFAGRMAAGPPIDTERWPDEWLPIRLRRRESAQTHYLAQAVGTSMVNAGIADGALVLVRRAEAARYDQIVVVWLPGDGLTIKRYRLAGGRPTLAWEDGSGRTVPLREGARVQGVFVRVVD